MIERKVAMSIYLSGVLFFGLFSASASAFSVWAVNGGASSSSNSAGSTLDIAPGTGTPIDLYFDTEGDISWGWDITLEVSGVGTVSGVTGGDINGGLGTAQSDGGWRQLGGNAAVDLVGSSVLMFSFLFDASPGAMLSIGNASNYTSGNTFGSEAITPNVLVSAVPLPTAVWLLGSGLVGLIAVGRRKKG